MFLFKVSLNLKILTSSLINGKHSRNHSNADPITTIQGWINPMIRFNKWKFSYQIYILSRDFHWLLPLLRQDILLSLKANWFGDHKEYHL